MHGRTSFATLAVVAATAAGCGGSSTRPSPTVVAFSDLHFDPCFDPELLPVLEAAPVSAWAGIFTASGHTDPGHYGGTTNFTLLQTTLDTFRELRPRPTLVVFGGDILVQDFSTAYYLQSRGHDEAAMKAFALKTVTFVVRQIRASLGTTPVYFTLGNWDDYAGSFGLEPEDPFLADTAALFYDDLLAGAADRVGFEATYRMGGYYAAEVPGTDVVIVALNTLFLAPQAPAGIEAAVEGELDWLDGTLAGIEASGRRAWLVLHVPPGGDLATTGGNVSPGGQISGPTMMLEPLAQGRLLAVLAAHRGVLAAAFTGHTHMDEYRVAVIPMEGIPGITALMGNSPAFKTFTVASDSTLQGYVSWAMDLSDASASFGPLYDFSSAYGLPGPLAPALTELVAGLRSSPAAEATYRGNYGAGHPPSKPITDLNWPVYRCGISFMDAQGLTTCVNGP